MKVPTRLSSQLTNRIQRMVRDEQSSQLTRMRRRLRKLEARVDELSAELVDARSQGRHAAELADLVTELLANEASRKDPEFIAILERYTSTRA